MNRLWQKIAGALARFRPRPLFARSEPEELRFICRCPVTWESGGQRGRAELRQLSGQEMRLYIDRPLLSGRSVRVRPVKVGSAPSLLLDEVQATVLSSRRCRRGGNSVVLRLNLPEKVSRFAWFRQLRRTRRAWTASPPRPDGGLRLVQPGGHC